MLNGSLQSLQPPPRVDLKDIPKHIKNARGEDTLNVEWVREWVRTQKEDKQAAHAAASLPTEALNKGTEPLIETAKRTFGTRCTARTKSEFCKGYTFADKLMPCHIMDKQKKACGIEDKCVSCYNSQNKTNFTEKE